MSGAIASSQAPGDRILAERERLRELADRSLLAHFAEWCDGVVVVDSQARIVWMNDKYPRRLGMADPAGAIGQPIEKIIPNSRMRWVVESGRPTMLDAMDFGNQTFVVTRLPLHDADGQLVGAVGFMLYDDPLHLVPLVSRYQRLRADLAEVQTKLAEARRTKYTFSSFIGAGQRCLALKQAARRAARATAPVLIQGETGTGKELLAQAIHAAGPRAKAPFVAVNIAAVPETLIETEFFGVAPGAYTGADKRGRAGKFSLADGGTLFLDEIGDMPLALQAKLLRVLQEHEFEPVGSNDLVPVDVRIIAATSRDLQAMAAAGQFRSDLYYRLNVISLVTPPLRERIEDLPVLCEYLVEGICRQQGMPQRGITPEAVACLRLYEWPGNVRELANMLERALLMSDGENLDAADIELVLPKPRRQGVVSDGFPVSLGTAVAAAERAAIEVALAAHGGNKVKAAKTLGISRAALYEKIAALGLDAS